MADVEGQTALVVPRLGDFIRSRYAELIAEWQEALGRLPLAGKLRPGSGSRQVSSILECVAGATDVAGGAPGAFLAIGVEEHALERLDEGFDLVEIITEYTLLRSIVLRRWRREAIGPLHPDDVVILDEAFDRAIHDSAARYNAARGRMMGALDRILAVAADHRAEDAGYLRELLRVLMETTATVDSVTLLMRDGDVLRVRESVGLERAVQERFSVHVGEGFAGRIAAEKRPRELRSAATDPLVLNPYIRARGVRALYGVPMLRGGEVIGVAHMGSRTAWEFSTEDKVLFRAMVSRVAALLLQAELAERERAARIESEAALAWQRALFASVPVGIAFFDAALRFIAINEWMARINGFPAPAHIGRRMSAVLPAERAGFVDGHLRQVLETREPVLNVEFEAATLARPADRRAWQSSFFPVIAVDGAVLGAGALVLDVTSRKLAQETLQRREAEYRTLAESMPQIVWTAKPDGQFDYFNEGFSRYTGSPQSEGLGLGWRSVIHPEDLPRVEQVWMHAVATGQPADVEHRLRRHDGVSRWFVSRASALKDEHGEVLRWFGSTTDIDDLKRAQRDLTEALSDRERVIAILGHELRNPLGIVALSAEALLRREDLQPPFQTMLARIASAAGRMTRIITDLMDFSRARSRKLPIHPSDCDLAELCREVIGEFEAICPGRPIVFRENDGARGRWDRGRLAQVVSNLLANALRYGAADTAVLVAIEAGADTVALRVENRGPAIPPSVLPHIFEPFRRGGKPGERGAGEDGLGLGLYIVHEIVRAHGGRAEVTSDEAGTAFTVILPRAWAG